MEGLTETERKNALNKTATLKMQTIAQILKCIDISSSRGAFKASEMSFVGSLYDMLSKGLSDAFSVEINKKTEKSVKKLETIKEEN